MTPVHRNAPRRLALALILILAGCRPGPVTQPAGARPPERLPLPTGRWLDPAGPSFDVGNMPLAAVPVPGEPGKLVLLLCGYRDQGVQVIDTRAGRVLQTLTQPGAFAGLAFSPDGKILYASGADDDSVFRYDWRDGQAVLRDRLPLAQKEGPNGSRFPAGIGVSPDGSRLYVAENLAASLAVLDAASGRVLERHPAGRFPYAVAVAPDGSVWVSAWGGGAVDVFTPDGAGGLTPAGEVEVGRHPSALLLNRDGSRLFAASASTDRVAVVDTHSRRIVATLRDAPPAGPDEGSTPNALALSADGRRLFVAEADANAVAVFDLSGGDDRLAGRIPVQWYPTALALDGDALLAINGKGRGTRPNPGGPRPGEPLNPRTYTLGQLDGTVTVLPTAWSRAELADLTRRVEKANLWDRTRQPRQAESYPPFRHVIYVLKENRTYDQVFGDLPDGDGDPSLVFFPAGTTRNHRALAARFGLFDRFFVNAEVSSQGHVWSTAAYVTDYGEKTTPSVYSDRRDEGDDVGEAEEPAHGFIWHRALEKGLTFLNFGEATQPVQGEDGSTTWRSTRAGLEDHTHPLYPGWNLEISDQKRADIWTAELAQWERSGAMPSLQFLWLPNDHTAGARPGLPTPRAYMADNDRALGRIVEALSRSRFWKDTVVFVLEDDAQAGPDHVDSHRSVMLVISPYNRPGTVHRFVNTTDVLATIEEILGLAPLSHFDHFGRPLTGIFAAEPDPRPYEALMPDVPWTEVNPPAGPGAAASARLNLSIVDAGEDELFNLALWQAIKGDAPFPGETSMTLLELQRGR